MKEEEREGNEKTKFSKLRVSLDHDLTIKLIIKIHHDKCLRFRNVSERLI